MEFEAFLREHQSAIERFVKFKISDPFDADDILQETYLTAANKFNTLQNKESFKPWILSIARNKCNDHFRKNRKFCKSRSKQFPKKRSSAPAMACERSASCAIRSPCLVTNINRSYIYIFGKRCRRRISQKHLIFRSAP